MLKQYQHWIEAPVDAIVLGLYHLQTYYNNEIQRGLSGLGIYSLRPVFTSLQRPQDEIITLKAYSPEEIVQRIRNEATMKTASSEEEILNIESGVETHSTNFDYLLQNIPELGMLVYHIATQKVFRVKLL